MNAGVWVQGVSIHYCGFGLGVEGFSMRVFFLENPALTITISNLNVNANVNLNRNLTPPLPPRS